MGNPFANQIAIIGHPRQCAWSAYHFKHYAIRRLLAGYERVNKSDIRRFARRLKAEMFSRRPMMFGEYRNKESFSSKWDFKYFGKYPTQHKGCRPGVKFPF